ncbi:hypothetical protein GH714_000143 [Hevea brasiliensis]|uniref:Vacuolar iron transporter n=1 Tax=Hevea brasiliensis TaxID=3981 RepID=A0A6A6NB85_HEVBR|nr:hypothetical protein GH714_000143 [Hevea brasiliensis]
MATNTNRFPLAINDVEQQATVLELEANKEDFDYTKRAQWLRAAVLGANDGLVSTASLMMGVGAVKQDIKAMILSGFAGLVAGACSMAIGAVMGKAPAVRSSARVLVGGLMAMAITFGLTKLIGSSGL